jgi:hypothetical protein
MACEPCYVLEEISRGIQILEKDIGDPVRVEQYHHASLLLATQAKHEKLV